MSHDLCGVITSDKESLRFLCGYKTNMHREKDSLFAFKAELKEPLLVMKIRGLGSWKVLPYRAIRTSPRYENQRTRILESSTL